MTLKHFRVGKRNYFHSSVLQFIELHQEISKNPQEIIRNLVREKLVDARNSGWNGPPFDPQILASIMGIRCKKSEKLAFSHDAELHTIDDGNLVIIYNPRKPKTRQNFSIAHEIAHTFFPKYEDNYKARHKIGQFDIENEVEFLCDLAASEIIMPTPEFDLDLKNIGISLKSLKELSKRYEVSLEATAIRMVRTDLNCCALMILSYSHKPTEVNEIENASIQQNLFDDHPWVPPPKKLRVQYFFRAKHFSSYIPKHKSIEESSPIFEVSATRKPFRGITTLNLANQILDAHVEAMALPGTHKSDLGSSVLVLLFQR